MIAGTIALIVFGVLFAAMALTPLVLDEAQHEVKPVAQPVPIGSRRVIRPVGQVHGHTPQAA